MVKHGGGKGLLRHFGQKICSGHSTISEAPKLSSALSFSGSAPLCGSGGRALCPGFVSVLVYGVLARMLVRFTKTFGTQKSTDCLYALIFIFMPLRHLRPDTPLAAGVLAY